MRRSCSCWTFLCTTFQTPSAHSHRLPCKSASRHSSAQPGHRSRPRFAERNPNMVCELLVVRQPTRAAFLTSWTKQVSVNTPWPREAGVLVTYCLSVAMKSSRYWSNCSTCVELHLGGRQCSPRIFGNWTATSASSRSELMHRTRTRNTHARAHTRAHTMHAPGRDLTAS